MLRTIMFLSIEFSPKIFRVGVSFCSYYWNLLQFTKFQQHQICRYVLTFVKVTKFQCAPAYLHIVRIGSYALNFVQKFELTIFRLDVK